MIVEYPVRTVFGLLVISILVFAVAIRVYERPDHNAYGDQIFNDYLNSVYFKCITMTTVGYGDIYPLSMYGKVISVILAFFAAFIISLFVVVSTNILEFSKRQRQVFHQLLISKKAANAIISSYKYHKLRRRFKEHTAMQTEINRANAGSTDQRQESFQSRFEDEFGELTVDEVLNMGKARDKYIDVFTE